MIYFISFPKCGRTWCRTIVDQYAERTGQEHEQIRYTHLGLGNVKDKQDKGEPWRKEGATRIHLSRNWLDALVSLYHDQKVRVSEVANEYKKGRGKTIDDFVLNRMKWVSRYEEERKLLEFDHELNYEDMISEPERTFLPVMEIIFGEVDRKVFKEVIEFCEFENMSELERKKKLDLHVGKGYMRKGFYKTRKGKVGSHKEELRPETIEKLKQQLES